MSQTGLLGVQSDCACRVFLLAATGSTEVPSTSLSQAPAAARIEVLHDQLVIRIPLLSKEHVDIATRCPYHNQAEDSFECSIPFKAMESISCHSERDGARAIVQIKQNALLSTTAQHSSGQSAIARTTQKALSLGVADPTRLQVLCLLTKFVSDDAASEQQACVIFPSAGELYNFSELLSTELASFPGVNMHMYNDVVIASGMHANLDADQEGRSSIQGSQMSVSSRASSAVSQSSQTLNEIPNSQSIKVSVASFAVRTARLAFASGNEASPALEPSLAIDSISHAGKTNGKPLSFSAGNATPQAQGNKLVSTAVFTVQKETPQAPILGQLSQRAQQHISNGVPLKLDDSSKRSDHQDDFAPAPTISRVKEAESLSVAHVVAPNEFDAPASPKSPGGESGLPSKSLEMPLKTKAKTATACTVSLVRARMQKRSQLASASQTEGRAVGSKTSLAQVEQQGKQAKDHFVAIKEQLPLSKSASATEPRRRAAAALQHKKATPQPPKAKRPRENMISESPRSKQPRKTGLTAPVPVLGKPACGFSARQLKRQALARVAAETCTALAKPSPTEQFHPENGCMNLSVSHRAAQLAETQDEQQDPRPQLAAQAASPDCVHTPCSELIDASQSSIGSVSSAAQSPLPPYVKTVGSPTASQESLDKAVNPFDDLWARFQSPMEDSKPLETATLTKEPQAAEDSPSANSPLNRLDKGSKSSSQVNLSALKERLDVRFGDDDEDEADMANVAQLMRQLAARRAAKQAGAAFLAQVQKLSASSTVRTRAECEQVLSSAQQLHSKAAARCQKACDSVRLILSRLTSLQALEAKVELQKKGQKLFLQKAADSTRSSLNKLVSLQSEALKQCKVLISRRHLAQKTALLSKLKLRDAIRQEIQRCSA
jgi:hypothetical protein